ncbi:MAG: hypothetical protein DHS20C17_35190 [Cyclobacteriaceae bacterium]|nr:MAG: hypothetical protein DHS20C17_35190 [Cyclobacteriaceae bacterium]
MAHLMAARELDKMNNNVTTTTTTGQTTASPFQFGANATPNVALPNSALLSNGVVNDTTPAGNGVLITTNAPLTPTHNIGKQVISEVREMRSTLLEMQDDLSELRDMNDFSLELHAKHFDTQQKLARSTNNAELVNEIEMYKQESDGFLSEMRRKREKAWSRRFSILSPQSATSVRITDVPDEEELPRKPPRKQQKTPQKKPKPAAKPAPVRPKATPVRTSLAEKYNLGVEDVIEDSEGEMTEDK